MNKPRYEYKREYWVEHPDGYRNKETEEEFINRVAVDGWHLVCVEPKSGGYLRAWFERQKEDE